MVWPLTFPRLGRLLLWTSIGAFALAANGSRAQGWPTGPVSIIVPSSPGSGPDVLARSLGERLAAATQSTIIVENKPGANGVIGTAAVANAPPNGAALLLYDRLTLTVNPALLAKLPYHPKDLVGVTDVASVDLVFVCRANAPYKTWDEMLAFARSKAGALTVGTAGIGSVHHLSLELIKRHYGIGMVDVPYRGIAPAVAGLLSGELGCVITGQETVLEHIRSGRLRALAIGAARRSPLLPDVPTLREVGAPDDLLIPTHFTLFVHAATPRGTVERMQEKVAEALRNRALIDRFAERGLIVAPSSPDQVAQAMAQEQERFTKLIRDAGIKME
ncbi:MAG: hypothetical protein ABS43_06785 [Bordetella sp. SCN 67-23]|nr:tripartite tricarboxylate transporter substrate binding protein [Burkholderiales bacterium]ODS75141.1 MAG: hypothetical protein ABS43_06785 [Bordetella sp. SCN 67-23]ODU97886.1 MAG: hypothetical protein ABT00_00060 [Bordetella sp. SCN 68-11]OJW86519.1 MAG: hypothetical protein BGO71_14790 [Burkholderiales bacterium 67-32]